MSPFFDWPLQASGDGTEERRRERFERMKTKDYIIIAARVALAAVFIYAALQKIGKPLAFADEIRMYHILDIGTPLYIMAIVLPWVELITGLCLLAGFFIRGSCLLLVALNTVFIIAVALRTHGIMADEGIPFFKVYFDCGCGFGATFAWRKLAEDSLFLALSLAILLAPTHSFVLNPWRD